MLNESVTKKQIFGLVLGFIGVVILVNPESSSTSIFSAVLCLIGATCYSFSTVFIQKYSASTNKFVLVGWSIVFSSLIMIPITVFNLPLEIPSSNALLSALWLGGISTGLAFFGYVYLIEKIGAVKTSTVAYFLPIFGIIWGGIFLNEVITFGIIIGCATILIGVFFATSNNRNNIKGEIHAN
jgi:Permeases of the drug/metabolite transporter (DMT) superfamily